jgi:hypothetical protein
VAGLAFTYAMTAGRIGLHLRDDRIDGLSQGDEARISLRVPGTELVELGGKPLIAHA